MRATYGAARWRQQEANADSRPFLMYDARDDRRTRPAHRAMDGQVFRIDDPIWRTHYPPNGWRCRCRVRALTERQVRDRGLRVRSSEDHLRRVDQVAGFDKRTGKPVLMPGTRYTWRGGDGREHALLPDAGWSYNPGRHDLGRDAADRMIAKIDAAPPDLAAVAVGQPWRNPLFRRHLEGRGDAGDWPVARMPDAALAATGGRSPTVRLSASTAAKQALRHPDLAPDDYARVQRILDRGKMFRDRRDPRAAVGFIEADGRLWRAVVKATENRAETYLASLHRAHRRQRLAARERLERIDRED